MAKKRLTIKDLATMAGVASSTISRVLNNNPGVSAETRARIRRLIEETGFKPSAKARSFFHGRAGAVGLLIPRPNEYVFSNPFYLDIMRGAADAAMEAKMNLLLVTAEKDFYDYLYEEQRVDGLILASTREDDMGILRLIEEGHPFVLIGRFKDGAELNQIEVDDLAAAREATEYLISLGHRRIAFIGGPITVASGRDRYEGYRQALGRHGIPFDEALVVLDDLPLPATGERRAKEILARRPETTAFFAFNDLVAVGVMEALRSMGRQPGEDISVLGFDDLFIARYTVPPLTTIRQSGYDKGALAVKRLLEVLAGDRNPRKVVLPTTLIIRESCHRVRE
ncbi:MAG: LacI family transcriptional regulator [Firmicutes bacterium]|nr:LacI family transcriptional regulator [Bacillota bacterium]